jgi:hypothetical protein
MNLQEYTLRKSNQNIKGLILRRIKAIRTMNIIHELINKHEEAVLLCWTSSPPFMEGAVCYRAHKNK